MYDYLLVRSPKGYIDFEPAENEEWIQYILGQGYEVIGTAQCEMGLRELDRGIAKSVLQRNNVPRR